MKSRLISKEIKILNSFYAQQESPLWFRIAQLITIHVSYLLVHSHSVFQNTIIVKMFFDSSHLVTHFELCGQRINWSTTTIPREQELNSGYSC